MFQVEQQGEDLDFARRDAEAGGRARERTTWDLSFNRNPNKEARGTAHRPRPDNEERRGFGKPGYLRRRLVRPVPGKLSNCFFQNERKATVKRHAQWSDRDASDVLGCPCENDVEIAVEHILRGCVLSGDFLAQSGRIGNSKALEARVL